MRYDVDLHRSTIKLPGRLAGGKSLEMSVIDVGPTAGAGYRSQNQAQADLQRLAPTMVFIHGFGGRAAYWEYQIEQFQADYRVIALDLRGHGYTDAPTEADNARYDVAELVTDIEAALEILGVPQRFILVCHSFGGALASYYIKHNPRRVSTLIIIASAVQFRLRLAGRLLLRIPPLLLTGVRQLLPYVGLNAVKMYPPAHVVYLQNKNSLRNWDGTSYLQAITCPTMVILGQRDILFSQESYKQVAALIPGAEELIIPVSAHQVMVERPDAVNRAIERFVQMQVDPEALAEYKSAQKILRREARKALEGERPWLKFYDARTPYRIRPPTVALPRLLETTARRFANTVALHYLGANITWRELDRLANRFAHGLLSKRLKPGERVMLALPNCPQWLIAYFGVLKAGAVAVLTDAASDQEQLLNRIHASGAVMLISDKAHAENWRGVMQSDPRADSLRRIIFASMFDWRGWREQVKYTMRYLAKQQLGRLSASRRPNDQKHIRRHTAFNDLLLRGRIFPPDIALAVTDIAVIVYTHGSAKLAALAVPLSHANLAANALQLRHWLPESRPGDERFLAQQALSTVYGLTCLLHLGVYLGATLILLPSDDVQLLLRTVQKMRPTYFPTTPKVVRQIAHTPGVRRFGLASIRVCAVSGSPLPQEIREGFEKITRGRLIEAYGLAEASPAVLAMPLAARRPVGVVGLPLPDTEAKIVDPDTGITLALDAIGELWVRGPQVFAGYDGADAVEEIGRLSAARLSRDGWLATGDMASVDEDGFFTIIDRKDNMLWRGGQRVFLRQIEEVLFSHPAVALALVRKAGTADAPQLQATVTLHQRSKAGSEELLRYCAKYLHPGALPDSIVIDENKTVVLF